MFRVSPLTSPFPLEKVQCWSMPVESSILILITALFVLCVPRKAGHATMVSV